MLGRVQARATLCLLRLHVRNARNSESQVVAIPFYQAPVTERAEGVAQFLRLEDRRIDPPDAPWDDLRPRNKAALEQQAGVRRA